MPEKVHSYVLSTFKTAARIVSKDANGVPRIERFDPYLDGWRDLTDDERRQFENHPQALAALHEAWFALPRIDLSEHEKE